jgi:hypothetical protein
MRRYAADVCNAVQFNASGVIGGYEEGHQVSSERRDISTHWSFRK